MGLQVVLIWAIAVLSISVCKGLKVCVFLHRVYKPFPQSIGTSLDIPLPHLNQSHAHTDVHGQTGSPVP